MTSRGKPGHARKSFEDILASENIVLSYFASVLPRKGQKGFKDGWYAILWRLRGSPDSGVPAEKVAERGPFATEEEARVKARTFQLLS